MSDLRGVVRAILAHRWLVIPVVLVAIGASVWYTLSLPAQYRSSVTYVVKPTIQPSDDALGALAVVSRQSEIASTYAQVAASRRIKDAAATAAGLPSNAVREMDVRTLVIAGTNLLRIDVFGPDPDRTRTFAQAVGDATESYVQGLYDAFQLVILDAPQRPRDPTEPNVPVYLAIGIVLSLLLGGGVALLAEALASTRRDRRRRLAPGEAELRRRLEEEMRRTRLTGIPCSLALLEIRPTMAVDPAASATPSDRRDAAYRIGATLAGRLPRHQEPHLLDDGSLAIPLPGQAYAEAIHLASHIEALLTMPSDAGGALLVGPVPSSVATYEGGPMDAAGLIALARRGLEVARGDDPTAAPDTPRPDARAARAPDPARDLDASAWSNP